MTQFDESRILITQGADRNAMALMLEALHEAELLPTWGPGQTGADLSTREVVSVILGSTAPDPATAAAHVIATAGLIRADGKSLGEALTATMEAEPHTIAVEELTVSADGQSATIRYAGGKCDTFYATTGPTAFRHCCVIRGSLLSLVAMTLHHPPESGWKQERSAEQI